MNEPQRHYYVDVPVDVARARWQDFTHELDYPGADLQVRIDTELGRTRVSLSAADERDAGRMDYAMRRFRLFLESRGLIERASRRARP